MPDRHDAPARYALCDQLLAIARRCARAMGVPRDAVEDCAVTFAERVLFDETEKALRPPCLRQQTGVLHERWVTRNALNHAIDFRRRLAPVIAHEVPWPHAASPHATWIDGAKGEVPHRKMHEQSPDAERLLLRRLVCEALWDGAMELDEVPRALLLAHYIEGRSASELATAMGSTIAGVEQRLVRARHRVRAFLERRDWTVEELMLYLAPAPE